MGNPSAAPSREINGSSGSNRAMVSAIGGTGRCLVRFDDGVESGADDE